MLPDLRETFEDDNRFRFVVLDFPEMMIPPSKDGKEFHPELRNGFVEFFPTFILFPGNLWNNKDSRLKGVPKHKGTTSKVDYSKASILAWIDDTLRRNPLFLNNEKVGARNENDRYIVPTYGAYNKFRGTKVEGEF